MPRNRFALAGIVWTPKLTPPEASAHIRRHRVTSGGSGLALAVQKHVRRPALFSWLGSHPEASAHIRRHRLTSGGSGLALAVQKHVRRPALFSWQRDDEDVAASIREKQGWLRDCSAGRFAPRLRNPSALRACVVLSCACRAKARQEARQNALPSISRWCACCGAGVERDVARTTPAQHPRALRYATASLSPRGPAGGHVVAGGACAALAARFGL